MSRALLPPVLDETVQPNPVKLFDMMEGYKPIRNILGMGDPDVHRIGGQWWMFFGAFHTGFKTTCSAPACRRGRRSVAMTGR